MSYTELGFCDLRNKIRIQSDPRITICYQYYNDNESLEVLLKNLEEIPEEILRSFKFQIVDDCSKLIPLESYESELRKYQISAYKIVDDIPWNQSGARNLNAYKCDTKFAIFTDIDHFFEQHTLSELKRLVEQNLVSAGAIYRFSRKTTKGEVIKPHVNTYLSLTNTFKRIGGIDEDFAGQYGYEDKFFIEEAKASGYNLIDLDDFFTVVYSNKSGNQKEQVSRNMDRNVELYKVKMDHAIFRSYLSCRFSYVKIC